MGVGSPGTGAACEKGLWWGVAQKETDHSGREVGGMAPAAQGCPGCAGRLLCKHNTLRLGAEWSKSKARDDGGAGAGSRGAWEVNEGFGFPVRKVRASPPLRDKEETGHVLRNKTRTGRLQWPHCPHPLGAPRNFGFPPLTSADLPDSATSAIGTPCSYAMKPRTEKMANPATKLVPLLRQQSMIQSLWGSRKRGLSQCGKNRQLPELSPPETRAYCRAGREAYALTASLSK